MNRRWQTKETPSGLNVVGPFNVNVNVVTVRKCGHLCAASDENKDWLCCACRAERTKTPDAPCYVCTYSTPTEVTTEAPSRPSSRPGDYFS
jgi:hypothetical protein